MRAVIALVCLTLLSACHTQNPYQQSALPMPPAPQQMQSAPVQYPAPVRDYARYRSWAWQQLPTSSIALDTAQLQEVVAEALDQRGLRPAAQGSDTDLLVSVHAQQQQRQRTVYDERGYSSGYYGAGYYRHRPYGPGYGAGYYGPPPMPRTYVINETLWVVQIRLLDGADGSPIWSGSSEGLISNHTHSLATLRKTVQDALQHYPPF